MSVFQLHDFWSTKVGNNEEYDIGCMAIGNVDNSNPSTGTMTCAFEPINYGCFQKIKLLLRLKEDLFEFITLPDLIIEVNLELFCYIATTTLDIITWCLTVEDLIHEEDLGVPIIQVAIGRFLPNSANMQGLAILHPRRLSVYEFVPQGISKLSRNTDIYIASSVFFFLSGNAGGKAAYYTFTKIYHHDLGMDGKHFTAFNMIYGPFGGAHGKDLIMVQSMDGKLQFFDQSAEAFSRQIVDCLLPGCFLYLPRMDAFVTSNYANRVECYRYHVLVNTQSEIGEDGKSQGQCILHINCQLFLG